MELYLYFILNLLLYIVTQPYKLKVDITIHFNPICLWVKNNYLLYRKFVETPELQSLSRCCRYFLYKCSYVYGYLGITYTGCMLFTLYFPWEMYGLRFLFLGTTHLSSDRAEPPIWFLRSKMFLRVFLCTNT